jgi:hypothetical protein
VNFLWRPPRDLLGRVRWGFLLAALACTVATFAEMLAADETPLAWRVVGVVLVLATGAGIVNGHRRAHFGSL